jgi:RNA polymerase sigma-70 factor (ECF subfamily)
MTTAEAILSHAFPIADTAHPELEAAVREHAGTVFRVAYSVLRNHHDAEDVAQETFLRALRHLHKLPQIQDRRVWLVKIAWRLALDRVRKMRNQPAAPLDPLAEAVGAMRHAGATAEQIASRREMTELLETLVAALPRGLREVLILATVEELQPAEIALALGVTDAAVRSRLHRARLILRERLAGLLETSHDR